MEDEDAPEARWVLVDVCETLELYRSAYKTLRPLVTHKDKAALKRLQKLQEKQEQGDKFALYLPNGGGERERKNALFLWVDCD